MNKKNKVQSKKENIFFGIPTNILSIKNVFLYTTFLAAIIGGSFQIFMLSHIGIFYLRFFSVSQMVADMVTILFPILIGIVIIITFVHSYCRAFSKINLLSSLIIILGLPLFSYLRYRDECNNFGMFIFVIIFLIVMTFVMKIVCNNKKYASKVLKFLGIKNSVLLVVVFGILAVFIGVANYSDYFYKTLISPNNFLNKEYVCNKESSKNICYIKYFNDKYIFIERNNNKIEVLRLDKFFEKRNDKL